MRLGRLPFDHDRQLASVVVRGAGGVELIVKGAPEAVLARCGEVAPGAHAVLERLFGEGERVVAVATRGGRRPDRAGSGGRARAPARGLPDVRRPAAGATREPRSRRLQAPSGITVKIITGDNGLVARKVCSDIGMVGRRAS